MVCLHLIMQRWKRAWVWLTRIGHCRGFGVQSPTDYRFVRGVINEHAPYYLYEDLARELPGLDSLKRKMCRLYFRLSNHCQAAAYIDLLPEDASRRYVSAACGKTRVQGFANPDEVCKVAFSTPLMARAACTAATKAAIDHLLSQQGGDVLVVLEGIKDNDEARGCWKEWENHPLAAITYDLYYCGIIIATKRRYKKNYIINF